MAKSLMKGQEGKLFQQALIFLDNRWLCIFKMLWIHGDLLNQPRGFVDLRRFVWLNNPSTLLGQCQDTLACNVCHWKTFLHTAPPPTASVLKDTLDCSICHLEVCPSYRHYIRLTAMQHDDCVNPKHMRE